MKIHLDFETRSTLDLNRVGAWKYALHPSTEILCIGWQGPTDSTPRVLRREDVTRVPLQFPANAVISAHNAHFEYAIYNLILHRRYGWPALWEPSRWSCTMARALMCGLPGKLADLTRVLECKTPKDLEGRRVMQQLCRPLEYDVLGDPIYDNDPAKFARLYQYNATDVKVEMEVDSLLPELPTSERAIWELDIVMNRRGVAVDIEVSTKAAALAEKLTGDLNIRLRELTSGVIDKATQVMAIRKWMETQGVEGVESLDKMSITDILARPDVPQNVREVLSIRRQVGKSSTAKYVKTLDTACPDGRVRGVLQYSAAHTMRWGGRLIQPHNYPKGFEKPEDQARAIALVLLGDHDAFRKEYGAKAMDALSDMLRGTIIAAPGKQLACADFNAIEARVLFWEADDVLALGMYGRGESPYLDMANYIYNRTDITKKGAPKEYDIGKRTILGCGYGMGKAKFKDNVYSETAKVGTPVVISLELAERAVKAYRTKYSSVVRMWAEVESAAINAVKNPGTNYATCGGKVLWGMSRDRRFLVCKLPSGRYIWYWKPCVKVVKTPWGADKEAMRYWGVDPDTKQWSLVTTYGGMLVENVTQAIARDLLAHGMLQCEAAGFPMVLTVHDELLAEILKGVKTLDEFIATMCRLPQWGAGCPVAAEGWIGHRYRK